MAFKVNDQHWEVVCAFMEQHTDFAKGRLNTSAARDKHKQLWEDLTLKLNSLGFGERKVDKWQKVILKH